MTGKRKTIVIICIAVIAAVLILTTMEFSVYGSFNWSFHYSKTPEAELLDSGVLNNVSYENIGVVELDNKNVFAVFHIDPFDDESAGVLIAHMKKSGNKYQYLGYYHFFTQETDIGGIMDSESFMSVPRINGIVYKGSIEYMCGYGNVDEKKLPEGCRLVSYIVDNSEFNVIYRVEQ